MLGIRAKVHMIDEKFGEDISFREVNHRIIKLLAPNPRFSATKTSVWREGM